MSGVWSGSTGIDDHGWPEIFPREPSNLISRKEQEDYPWVFQCGVKGCYWRTAHPTQQHAQDTKDKHICGQEKRQMPQGPSIVEKFWGLLDDATKNVMESVAKRKAGETVDETAFNEARGNARGIANCIFIMSGYYDTPDVVAKHAVARYKASKAGEEMPPTIGVNGYNPQLDAERARSKAKSPAPKATPASPPGEGEIRNKQGKLLTEADVTGLTTGLKAGLPVVSLAAVYKLTPDQVEQVKASLEK